MVNKIKFHEYDFSSITNLNFDFHKIIAVDFNFMLIYTFHLQNKEFML